MELTERIVRIIGLDDLELLASDVAGHLHILDRQLKLVRSSQFVPVAIPAGSRPIYTLTAAGPWAVTKDMAGNIARWSLDTLDLLDFYAADSICDPTLLMDGEEPSPVMSRGITVWDGRVYVNNGFRQLVVLDLESFTVERIVPSMTGDIPIEHFCTDHPDMQVVSDKGGRIHFGSLNTLEFPTVVRADDSNIHRVRYDARHGRFWYSQDAGMGETAYISHGIGVVSADGALVAEKHFARNDVEFICFSPDHREAYAGGFDGELHVFDNSTEQLRIDRTITGFSHQLTDLVVSADGALNVLSQDGVLVRIDPNGRELARAEFRRQCIWDMQPSLTDPSIYYLATDDGVAVVSIAEDTTGTPTPRVLAQHVSGFGFTRRVLAVADGWLGLSWDHKVFRSAADGSLRWVRDLPAFGHTIAISPDQTRVLVATNDGGYEYALTDGRPLNHLNLAGRPVWASAYLPTGEPVLANRTGQVCAFEPDSATILWTLELDAAEYTKRMWAGQDALYVIGALGMKEISLDSRQVRRRFVELLENTVENGTIVGGIACATTYGCQVGAYDYESGEIIGLEEDVPDYPKALAGIVASDDTPYLIVGGRGGFLRLYRLDTGPDQSTFVRLHDVYLRRPIRRPAGHLHTHPRVSARRNAKSNA